MGNATGATLVFSAERLFFHFPRTGSERSSIPPLGRNVSRIVSQKEQKGGLIRDKRQRCREPLAGSCLGANCGGFF
jgi:hypothetical protein